MPRAHFVAVETWVFDLDNTLYSPRFRLFDQIERRMTAFVSETLGVDTERASELRAAYWREYGTTLAGLMAEHGVAPGPYLAAVHDIDLSGMAPAPDLATAIARLPGRKVVFTNGSREHARRVTAALGISGAFDALYGVEDAGYLPKPREAAYARVFGAEGLDPRRAAMFEDDPRNLEAPHRLGMRTVLVGAVTGEAPAHVHHRTDDLAGFLARLF
ncbi:pyrimidine 5'-nucleotidase [Amaricoccus sp.]|uniref:pyrimidine 5'-nucleotidase n=1 Tax=Amaricoccus sp. TaxID=1872485 RepID=UPI001B5E8C22|nr:pyrimidine 5'-nucleotidase [Amaricoccus sp.]MBP7241714.1 pyrimidine 5'-nucleotidase [Amaricoccus sp.]